MASYWYPVGLKEAWEAVQDLTDVTKVKVALYTGAYNAAHGAYDDVSGSVIDTPKVCTTDPTYTESAGVVKYDAGDPAQWATVAGGSTITGVIVYYDSGVAATSSLIAFLDADPDVDTNGGAITAPFAAGGIGTIDCT